ncbi:hypothetical protein [Promicromonospora sp. NPDC019610]|uniref:hypothetical protein n=1 Tax=Promicromonospora sp. NPDC019610 TaxID=3364405 RepID=UPI0037955352
MDPETPTARSQITVQWIPELGDVTEFVQLTFVPRRMAIYFTGSSVVGLTLTVGSWNYPAARTLAITLTVATIAALVWNLLVPSVVPRRLWAKQASARNPTVCRIDADGILWNKRQ